MGFRSRGLCKVEWNISILRSRTNPEEKGDAAGHLPLRSRSPGSARKSRCLCSGQATVHRSAERTVTQGSVGFARSPGHIEDDTPSLHCPYRLAIPRHGDHRIATGRLVALRYGADGSAILESIEGGSPARLTGNSPLEEAHARAVASCRAQAASSGIRGGSGSVL
jgi:hypothetical protein